MYCMVFIINNSLHNFFRDLTKLINCYQILFKILSEIMQGFQVKRSVMGCSVSNILEFDDMTCVILSRI